MITTIRVELPASLRQLAQLGSDTQIDLAVTGTASIGAVLESLEARYPSLRGTMRDQDSQQRRPFIRFFACQMDVSHQAADAPLPSAVMEGREPFIIIGAIAGG
jgi:molybdopterin synthase sulfur carrier subunit